MRKKTTPYRVNTSWTNSLNSFKSQGYIIYPDVSSNMVPTSQSSHSSKPLQVYTPICYLLQSRTLHTCYWFTTNKQIKSRGIRFEDSNELRRIRHQSHKHRNVSVRHIPRHFAMSVSNMLSCVKKCWIQGFLKENRSFYQRKGQIIPLDLKMNKGTKEMFIHPQREW